MRRAVRIVALLALGAALAGCTAAFRNFRAKPVDTWPPAGDSTRWPLSLRVYGTLRLDTARADLDPQVLAIWQDEAASVYADSGLFARIAEPWESGAWVAEVSFAVREESKIRGESFVLYVEPYRRSELLMRTRFRDPEGRSLGVVEASESLRTYVGLLGIPLSIGHAPSQVRRGVIRDLYRISLDRAVAEGILGGREPAAGATPPGALRVRTDRAAACAAPRSSADAPDRC